MEIEKGPATERFDLITFTDELIGDLKALRAGKISPHDAHARAALARQVLRSVHYVITAQKFIEHSAIPARVIDVPKGGGS